MTSEQGITKELTIGEVVTRTLELYRRDFTKYFVLFLIVEAIYGAALTGLHHVVTTPALPAHATGQQIASWFSTNGGALAASTAATLLVALVFYPVIYGSAVKMSSDQIQTGRADLEASVRFSASKLVWMWVLGLVVGVIVLIGFIALIIPGIILTMMFSLVLPVLLIENTDVVKTMSRSRELVGHRWLKTLGIIIVFGIIIAIAGAIASAIGGLFGAGSTEVTNILSAFYLPIVPIALTVFYYSNLARTAPPKTGGASAAQATVIQEGMKFCTNCGARLEAAAAFCPKCGAKQPA